MWFRSPVAQIAYGTPKVAENVRGVEPEATVTPFACMVTPMPVRSAPTRSRERTVRDPDAALEVVLDEVELAEEVEVTVLVVEVAVVVEVVIPVSSAATSFEKYDGRVSQGLPPPSFVM